MAGFHPGYRVGLCMDVMFVSIHVPMAGTETRRYDVRGKHHLP